MLQTLLGNTYPDAQLEQVCVLAGGGRGCVLARQRGGGRKIGKGEARGGRGWGEVRREGEGGGGRGGVKAGREGEGGG